MGGAGSVSEGDGLCVAAGLSTGRLEMDQEREREREVAMRKPLFMLKKDAVLHQTKCMVA